MVSSPVGTTLPQDVHGTSPGGRNAPAALRRTEYPAEIREEIARAISSTRQAIRPCARCGFFATAEICEICADATRQSDLLCVVEQPTDILPLEKTSAFRGRYHALGGRISPL